MVIFNDLRLSDNKKKLYIDCSVEGLDIYDDIYIKSVYLDYYKNTTTPGVPSAKALLVYENTGDDTTVKNLRKCVNETALDNTFGTLTFEGGLFYVIVTCDGTLPASVSNFACGTDDTVDIGLVLDWKMVYETGMQYVAAMNAKCANLCDGNEGFMNFVMLWHSLRLALASCDYTQLSILWEKFNRVYSGDSLGAGAGCGCNS